MQFDITNKDLQTLLTLYNQEVELFQQKLLDGEPWNNLRQHRRNITELSIALHKSHGFNVGRTTASNPAEFPKNEGINDQPVE